jgi:hypothetical protein
VFTTARLPAIDGTSGLEHFLGKIERRLSRPDGQSGLNESMKLYDLCIRETAQFMRLARAEAQDTEVYEWMHLLEDEAEEVEAFKSIEPPLSSAKLILSVEKRYMSRQAPGYQRPEQKLTPNGPVQYALAIGEEVVCQVCGESCCSQQAVSCDHCSQINCTFCSAGMANGICGTCTLHACAAMYGRPHEGVSYMGECRSCSVLKQPHSLSNACTSCNIKMEKGSFGGVRGVGIDFNLRFCVECTAQMGSCDGWPDPYQPRTRNDLPAR